MTVEISANFLNQGKPVSQGDVTLKACKEIPFNLEKQTPENGLNILAHSETGHHHAVKIQDGVTVYDQDEFISYIENKTDNVIELKHYRNFHTHAPIGIPPGKFKVTRQREYIADGYRRAAD